MSPLSPRAHSQSPSRASPAGHGRSRQHRTLMRLSCPLAPSPFHPGVLAAPPSHAVQGRRSVHQRHVPCPAGGVHGGWSEGLGCTIRRRGGGQEAHPLSEGRERRAFPSQSQEVRERLPARGLETKGMQLDSEKMKRKESHGLVLIPSNSTER